MIYQTVSDKICKKLTVVRPSDALPLFKPYFKYAQETFSVILLNGHHDSIKCCLISVGLINSTIVHPREVFCEAIRELAAAIIVGHNHPSGHLVPSSDDIAVTQRLKEAGDILGIPLLDHFIYNSNGEYYSFLEDDAL